MPPTFKYARNILLANITVMALGFAAFGNPVFGSPVTSDISNEHTSGILLHHSVIFRAEFVGKPVVDTLSFLRTEGFNIIFSTDLVKPTMLVNEAPKSTTLITLLNEILEPHGLLASFSSHQVVLITAEEQTVDGIEEPTLDSDKSTEIDEIIVNQRFPSNAGDHSNASYLFFSTQLEKLPELTGELFQSLKVLPNISGPEYSAKPLIRGGRDNELKVILNGYEIDSPYHFENYLPLFSVINPKTIDSTELFIGGFSAEYGDRLSAVANIQSKTPTGSASHIVDMNYLSQSYQFASGFNDDQASILFAARQGSGKELLSNIGNDNLDPKYYDLFSKLSIDLDDARLSWNTLISKDSEKYSRPGSLSFDEFSKGSNEKVISWVNMKLFLSENLHSSFQVSAEENSLAKKTIAFRGGATVDSLISSSKLGLKTDWNWKINRHTLKTGAEYKDLEAHYEYQRQLLPYYDLFTDRGFRAYVSTRDIVMDRSGHTLGLYVSDHFQATDSLVMEFGLRWDSQSYVDKNSALIDGSDEIQLSPRLNVVFKLTDRQVVYAHVGRYYQSLRIDELSLGDDVNNPQFFRQWEELDQQTLANFEQNYQPAEKLDQYSLAYQLQLSNGIDFRAEMFSKTYENVHAYHFNMFGSLQSLLPELAWDRVVNVFPYTDAEGFEFAIKGGSDKFNWQIAYSHLEANQSTLTGYTRKSISYSPSGISVTSYIRLSNHLDLSAWILYHPGISQRSLGIVQDQTNGDTATTFDVDYEQLQQLDHNLRFDLRLSYNREWDKFSLAAFVGLYNSLGNDNPSDVLVTENFDIQSSGLNNKVQPAFGLTLSF